LSISLIGADYESADIITREELFHSRRDIVAFWQRQGLESAILLTCNRFEIYVVAGAAEDYLKDFYVRFPSFLRCGYFLNNKEDILSHLIRLSSGLFSQLKGESEIQEQLLAWIKQEDFPQQLQKIVQEALFIGNEVRMRCGLEGRKVNIASLVFEDIVRNLGTISRKNILILGTGRVAQLFSLLGAKNVNLYFAAHRNFARAMFLAKQAQGRAIPLKEVSRVINDVDAVVAATASPHFILCLADIADILCSRQSPLYIYDLALPRGIEPRIGELAQVRLKNLDSLNNVFSEHNLRIQDRLIAAERLVVELVDAYAGEALCIG